jgi:hypothetical protein
MLTILQNLYLPDAELPLKEVREIVGNKRAVSHRASTEMLERCLGGVDIPKLASRLSLLKHIPLSIIML